MRIRWLAPLLVASCHRPHTALESEARVPEAPIVARVELDGPPPAIDTEDVGRSAAIAAVGPKSDTTRGLVDPGAQPFVYFTRPMTPDATRLHFEVEPRVGGETVWVDPYRAYLAGADFELGRHYEIRARGTVERDDGTSVEIDERWAFDTRPPLLTLELDEGPSRWWSGTTDDDAPEGTVPAEPITHWRAGLDVQAELRISADALRRHVSARAWPVGGSPELARPVAVEVVRGPRGHGLPAEFEWSAGPDSIHIHPASHWPANHTVEVTVAGEFTPRGGGPIAAPVRRRFRVTEGTAVAVTCATDFDDGCGPGGIDVRFSAPMAAKDLARVKVSPRPPNLHVHSDGTQGVSIVGDFEIDQSYRVELPAKLRDRLGQPVLGGTRHTLAFVPPPPAVDLVVSGGVLRPSLPATVGLESRWVRKALLRAAVPSERAWIELQGHDLTTVPFPSDVTQLTEREIDLDPSGRYAWSSIALDVAALAGGQRPLLVEVVPLEILDVAAHRRAPKPTRGLFQVTGHGLAVWRSAAATRVQIRDNATLVPSAGVELEVRDTSGKIVQRRTTDAQGLADLLPLRALPPSAALVARNSSGVALLEVGEPKPEAHENSRDDGEDRWLSEIVTERALYQPGETVSVVGWAAISTTRNAHGLLRPKAGAPVEIELVDRSDEVVARRRVAITRHGKYWAQLALPATTALGGYTVRAKLPERGRGLAHMPAAEVRTHFEVRDVVIPEFEVRTIMADAGLVRPAVAELVAHAGYYFGGPVPIEQRRTTTNCYTSSPSVPGLDARWDVLRPVPIRDERSAWSLPTEVVDGPPGELRLRIPTTDLIAGLDVVCDTDLAIQDASFSEVGAAERWYVHPSRYVTVLGQALPQSYQLDARAVDEDGKVRVVEKVDVEIARLEQRRDAKGNLEERPVRVHRCSLETTATGADARCTTRKLSPGRYTTTVTATVDGRAVSFVERWWISAREPKVETPRAEPTSLELSVDKPTAEPGQRVTLTMVAPKVSGPGVLSFSHGGLRRLVPFTLESGAASIELPVTDAWVPSVEFEAFVVTKGDTEQAPPRSWRDRARVDVGAEHRRLGVTVEAPATAGAGDDVTIQVKVEGKDGAPVDGRVALWAVDEAVHAMVPPRIPDFVRTFAAGRWNDTVLFETFTDVLRPYAVRTDPFEGGSYNTGYGAGYGSGSGAGFGGRSAKAPSVSTRRRFETTPIFIGDAPIERGVATIRGRMPENLSTFRLTAIASAEVEAGPGLGRFGHSDARIMLTAPLVVRPAMPRMLRPGDEAELAVLVDNLAGGAGVLSLEVDVVRGAESIEIVKPPVSRTELAAGAQQRFGFTVRARAPGKVEFELRARLAGDTEVRDAMQATLTVEAPDALRRHAAAYGSRTEDGAFAVALERPKLAPEGAVAVDVELNATMLGDLQSIARDLVRYPYGCVEQTTSGLLPLVALRGLAAQGYLDVDVREHIDVGIARLRSMQVDGGGLAYWPGARRAHLWGSAYALWVLEALADAGHEVPASLRNGLRDDLSRRIGTAAGEETAIAELDDVAATMVVQALVAAGARPTAVIERLFLARKALPTFARALLLMSAHAIDPEGATATTLFAELRAQVDERAGAAFMRRDHTQYSEYFDSPARTDAMVLLALQRVAPDDAVNEKLVRGLMIHRGDAAIANTQERAYTMLALAEFARHREKDVPALGATVWMAGTPTAAAKLEGRAAPPVHRTAAVALGDTEPRITIERRGKGRLYYRVGMTWTDVDAGKTAGQHGFAISRTLRTTAGEDATIAAGDLVAMDVVLTVDRMQRYVAIDVPLPPGLEAVDTSLGKGGRARVIAGSQGWWVSHQELRRDRAVIFADALRPGEHRTTIFLRAIAAGSFEMPPAEAHAMYTPELRGNTARARVDIAPRR